MRHFSSQKHFADFKTMRSLFLCCKERIIISLLYYVGILLFLLFRMKCCYLISHTKHTVTRIRSDFYILFKSEHLPQSTSLLYSIISISFHKQLSPDNLASFVSSCLLWFLFSNQLFLFPPTYILYLNQKLTVILCCNLSLDRFEFSRQNLKMTF